MSDYSNGKIYDLRCLCGCEGHYYGSTTQTLCQRKSSHIFRCFHPKNDKANSLVYNHMKEVSSSNFDIFLLETFPCKNKDELRAREQFWIDKDKPSLNKSRAFRTDEQKKSEAIAYQETYRIEKRDEISEKKVEYYEDNKERIKHRVSEMITCECGSEFRRGGKWQHERSIKHRSFFV
jgi:hypothetical protein